MQTTNEPDIFTVSRLNNEVRIILEDTFPTIWVEGEISNFAAPNSGHWYFSLKDAAAQVRCALFKMSQRRLGFQPKDGMHVLIRARVSLYPNRGDYQLIADHIEERGEGKLRRAYEELKKKLEAAGLFDVAHKKVLPRYPKQIGIITSATGAAIRDILTVLKRRYACLPIVIYPTLVQGATAAATIVKAIETANRRNECDVLILARGGGSLEDLWSFNEESVAKAIYASKLPIISGVGHEVDFTIADYVADVRAPTPSAAAEIVTPDRTDLLQTLTRQYQQLLRNIKSRLSTTGQQLVWIQKHLAQQHPKRKLAEKIQLVDASEAALVQAQLKILNKLQMRYRELDARLQKHTPAHPIAKLQQQMHYFQQHLSTSVLTQLSRQKAQLASFAAKLEALSPLATLARGYAIVTDVNNHILQDAQQVKVGAEVSIRLSKGSLACEVTKIE